MSTQDYTIRISSTGADDVNAALGSIGVAGDAAASRLSQSFAVAVQNAIQSGESMSSAINSALQSIQAPAPIEVNVGEIGIEEVQAALQALGLSAEQAQARIQSGFVRTTQSATAETNSIALLNEAMASGTANTAALAAALDRLTSSEINAAAGARGLTGAAQSSAAGFGSFAKSLAAVAAFMGIGLFERLSDGATDNINKLQQVTQGADGLQKAQEALFQTAQQTRAEYDGVTKTFFQLAEATKALNFSQEELLTATDSIAKALSQSGVTGATATRVMNDFTEAINRGEPTAQLFNRIMQQAPGLIDAMGQAMGLNRQQIEKMREETVKNKASLDDQSVSLDNTKRSMIGVQGTINSLTSELQKMRNNGSAYDQINGGAAKYKNITDQLAAAKTELTDKTTKLDAQEQLYGKTLTGSANSGLTVENMIRALITANTDLSAKQDATSETISGAFTKMRNAVEHFLQSQQEVTGYNRVITGMLDGITNHIQIVIPALITLGAAIAAVKFAKLVSDMGSVISGFAKMSSAVIGFAAANPILAAIVLTVGALAAGYLYLVESSGGVAQANAKIVAAFNEYKPVITGVVVALSALAAGWAALSLVSWIGTVAAFAAPVAAFAASWLLPIAGMVAVGVAIGVLIAKLGGFSGIWDAIKNGASTVWTFLTSGFKNIGTGVASDFSALGSGITAAWSAVWNSVVDIVTNIGSRMKATFDQWNEAIFTPAWNAIAAGWSYLWDQAVDVVTNLGARMRSTFDQWNEAIFTPVWNAVKQGFVALWSAVGQSITDAISGWRQLFADWATWLNTSVWQKVSSAAQDLWNGVKTNTQQAIQGWQNLFTTFVTWLSANTWQKISSAVSDLWGSIKQTFNTGITALEGYWTQFSDWIKSTFGTSIEDAFLSIWDKVQDKAQDVVDALKEKFSSIGSAISGAFSSAGDSGGDSGASDSGGDSGGDSAPVTSPLALRNGGTFNVPAYRDGGEYALPHFRSGGDYFRPNFGANGGQQTVPGTGRPDTHLAQFFVSPGERVIVQTPQQQRDYDKRMDLTKGASTGEPTGYRNGGAFVGTPHFRDGVSFQAAATNSTTGYQGYTVTKAPTAKKAAAPSDSSSSGATGGGGGAGMLTMEPWASQWAAIVASAPIGSAAKIASMQGLVPAPGQPDNGATTPSVVQQASLLWADGSSNGLKTAGGSSYSGSNQQNELGMNFTGGVALNFSGQNNAASGGDASKWWGMSYNDYVIKTTGAGIPTTQGLPQRRGAGAPMRDGGMFEMPAFRDGGMFDLGVYAARDGMDYDVPGAGGVDTRMMGLAVSPGEKVQVKTAAQQADDAKTSGQPRQIVINHTQHITTPDVASFKRSSRQLADQAKKSMDRAFNTGAT